MFKSLKEKLGGFFSKREKIEEKKEEVVEAKEKEKEPQVVERKQNTELN